MSGDRRVRPMRGWRLALLVGALAFVALWALRREGGTSVQRVGLREGRVARFSDARGAKLEVTPLAPSSQDPLVRQAEQFRTTLGAPPPRLYLRVEVDARKAKGRGVLPNGTPAVASKGGVSVDAWLGRVYLSQLAVGVGKAESALQAPKFSDGAPVGGQATVLYVVPSLNDPATSARGIGRDDPLRTLVWVDI